MNEPIRWRFHLLLLGVLTALTFSLRAELKGWYARDRVETGRRSAAARVREIEAGWQRLHYTDAMQPGFTEVFLQKIDWTKTPLSDAQRAKLEIRLRQTLAYFQTPNLDTYCRLKTEGLHPQFIPDRRIVQGLSLTNWLGEANALSDPKPFLRAYSDSLVERQGHVAKPRITAVCLDNVATALCASNTAARLFKGEVRKGFTVASEPLDPGFQYPSGNAPSDLNFQLSFYAQVNGPERAGSVYVNFTWLEAEQEWAFTRLILDDTLGISSLF